MNKSTPKIHKNKYSVANCSEAHNQRQCAIVDSVYATHTHKQDKQKKHSMFKYKINNGQEMFYLLWEQQGEEKHNKTTASNRVVCAFVDDFCSVVFYWVFFGSYVLSSSLSILWIECDKSRWIYQCLLIVRILNVLQCLQIVDESGFWSRIFLCSVFASVVSYFPMKISTHAQYIYI